MKKKTFQKEIIILIIEKIIEKIKYEGHPMGVLGAPRIFVLKVHTTMIRDIFEEVCQPSVHHHHE